MDVNPLPLNPAPTYVDVGEGVLMPDRCAARFTNLDMVGVASIDVVVALRDDAPVCESLAVDATDGGQVSADALRAIPVGLLVRHVATMHTMAAEDPHGAWNQPPYPQHVSTLSADARARVDGKAGARRRRVTPELLRQVSEVYRGAVSSGAPTQLVAEAFDVSHSTAARYVAKAREAGLLGETVPGRAGELDPRETGR